RLTSRIELNCCAVTNSMLVAAELESLIASIHTDRRVISCARYCQVIEGTCSVAVQEYLKCIGSTSAEPRHLIEFNHQLVCIDLLIEDLSPRTRIEIVPEGRDYIGRRRGVRQT